MSTAGTDFRFNNDRPPATNQKRSFLQRLNKRHGKLSLHMRSKRGERAIPRQTEPSHSPAPSLSTIETSEPSSVVSTTPTEQRYPETISRYYDVDDISPTNLNFSPSSRLEGEFEVPMHYAIAQNDTDGSRNFIQGMHEFMLRKHASNSSKPMETSHGLSLHSRHSSSGGTSSHMSEEQADDWLENPEDAKLHRQRTYSSSNMSAMVHAARPSDEIETDAAQQQMNEAISMPRHSRNISDPYPNPWNDELEEEGSRKNTITVKELKELKDSASPHKKVAFKLTIVKESNARGLLTLPDELLQAIAIRLDTNSAWLFRLSCKKLYDVIPKPDPPAGTEEDMQMFFGNIRNLFPANLIYCGQCRRYHPWMWGDDYYNDDRPGIQAHQCRRHLESGRRPREEILGPGNYLCDSCNTLRPDKKCKTCGKCVLCAKLRQTWMLMSWIEEECELCAASHSPKWKHWKGEFEGRHNPGAHREWMGV